MSTPLRNRSARRPDHGDVVAGVRTRSIDGIHASVAERLGSASMRYTKTRRALIDVLAETYCPLTVDQIRDNLAAPLSTVYRTLAILEEIRLVHRLTSNTSDFARFELAEDLLGHHHHLECAGCGTMIDITLADQLETDLSRALARLASKRRFAIDNYQLDIVGTCATCRATDRPPQGKRQRLAAVTPAMNASRDRSGSHV